MRLNAQKEARPSSVSSKIIWSFEGSLVNDREASHSKSIERGQEDMLDAPIYASVLRREADWGAGGGWWTFGLQKGNRQNTAF